MTDVQVSNARRIIFTALAVVAFWVLAWKVYWMACGWWYDWGPDLGPGLPGGVLQEFYQEWRLGYDNPWSYLIPSLCVGFLALIPTALVCLSRHNKVFTLRDRWTLASSALLFTSLAISFWRGLYDVFVVNVPNFAQSRMWSREEIKSALENHTATLVPVLLPIILTTAFVIFGAWRRAVRDAEVDAVGEDE